MELKKKGLVPNYGYNADAHSRFGLDYSTGRTMSPIRGEDYVEPEHYVLREVPSDMIISDYKNYLGDTAYRINIPSSNAADRYLSVVDERECNITANENGTFDVDLGPKELEVFQVHVDEAGNGSYKSKFMNAANIIKAFDKAMGREPKEQQIQSENPAIVVTGKTDKGEITYTSQQQADGSIKTETISQKSNQPAFVLHGKDARGTEFDYISQEQPDGSIKTTQLGE